MPSSETEICHLIDETVAGIAQRTFDPRAVAQHGTAGQHGGVVPRLPVALAGPILADVLEHRRQESVSDRRHAAGLTARRSHRSGRRRERWSWPWHWPRSASARRDARRRSCPSYRFRALRSDRDTRDIARRSRAAHRRRNERTCSSPVTAYAQAAESMACRFWLCVLENITSSYGSPE